MAKQLMLFIWLIDRAAFISVQAEIFVFCSPYQSFAFAPASLVLFQGHWTMRIQKWRDFLLTLAIYKELTQFSWYRYYKSSIWYRSYIFKRRRGGSLAFLSSLSMQTCTRQLFLDRNRFACWIEVRFSPPIIWRIKYRNLPACSSGAIG